MKYSIKGYEKKEVSFEVEAGSYEEAFDKARKKYTPGDFEVHNINDEIITCSKEAEWADDTKMFDDAIKRVKKDFAGEFEILKDAIKKNKAVKHFYVSFSGEGDDGRIDHTGTEPYELQDVVDESIGSYSITELLNSIADSFFEHIPVDWVNDQGGAGRINFKLNDKDEFVLEIECHSWEAVEAEQFYRTVTFGA